eukprot:gene8202-9744_t
MAPPSEEFPPSEAPPTPMPQDALGAQPVTPLEALPSDSEEPAEIADASTIPHPLVPLDVSMVVASTVPPGCPGLMPGVAKARLQPCSGDAERRELDETAPAQLDGCKAVPVAPAARGGRGLDDTEAAEPDDVLQGDVDEKDMLLLQEDGAREEELDDARGNEMGEWLSEGGAGGLHGGLAGEPGASEVKTSAVAPGEGPTEAALRMRARRAVLKHQAQEERSLLAASGDISPLSMSPSAGFATPPNSSGLADGAEDAKGRAGLFEFDQLRRPARVCAAAAIEATAKQLKPKERRKRVRDEETLVGLSASDASEPPTPSPASKGSMSQAAAEAVKQLRPPHQKLVQRLVRQGWEVGVDATVRDRAASHADLCFTSPAWSEFGKETLHSFAAMQTAIIRRQQCAGAAPTAAASMERGDLLQRGVAASTSRTEAPAHAAPTDPPSDPSKIRKIGMAEEEQGFTIVSRWGRVVHKKGCPCKPCLAQRRLLLQGSRDLAPPSQVSLRALLRAGTFVGRTVEYRSKAGDILLTGVVAKDGGIKCGHCNGAVVSCSEFEEHAGSKERRPDVRLKRLMQGGGDLADARLKRLRQGGGDLADARLKRLLQGGGDLADARLKRLMQGGGDLADARLKRLMQGGGDLADARLKRLMQGGGDLADALLKRLLQAPFARWAAVSASFDELMHRSGGMDGEPSVAAARAAVAGKNKGGAMAAGGAWRGMHPIAPPSPSGEPPSKKRLHPAEGIDSGTAEGEISGGSAVSGIAWLKTSEAKVVRPWECLQLCLRVFVG